MVIGLVGFKLKGWDFIMVVRRVITNAFECFTDKTDKSVNLQFYLFI